jgi:hypothetical protein
MTPTKETAARATRTRDPKKCRKSNCGDQNNDTSATLPAISEVPKEKEQEITLPPSQKSQESQDKNENTSGSRTNGRETRRNALPNRDRRHINRRLTNVRSDWQEFKLISFNVRGLNSESKQKIIYDLLKHNRPKWSASMRLSYSLRCTSMGSGPSRPCSDEVVDAGMRRELILRTS